MCVLEREAGGGREREGRETEGEELTPLTTVEGSQWSGVLYHYPQDIAPLPFTTRSACGMDTTP